MKKKNIIIMVGVLLLTLLIVILIILPKKEISQKDIKTLEKETKNNIEVVTSKDITYDKMIEVLGKKTANVNINLGENSYLRNRPSKELIKKYNLESYITKQEDLVKKVEKRYLDNLDYKMINSKVEGKKVCQEIEIKTYYYALYLNDLINLTNELVADNITDITKDEKVEINYFKGQIKAMEVLDKHLDEYENKTNEKVISKVCYKNNKPETEDEMLSLVIALQGGTYSNMDYSKEENIKLSNQRLKQYLSEI